MAIGGLPSTGINGQGSNSSSISQPLVVLWYVFASLLIYVNINAIHQNNTITIKSLKTWRYDEIIEMAAGYHDHSTDRKMLELSHSLRAGAAD